MKIFLSLLSLLLLALASTSPVAAHEEYALLAGGLSHKSGFPYPIGTSEWYALEKDGTEGFRLRKALVKVAKCYDFFEDPKAAKGNPELQTGRCVTSEGASERQVYIRGPHLKEGSLLSAQPSHFGENPVFITKKSFLLNKRAPYSLELTREAELRDKRTLNFRKAPYHTNFFIRSGERTQLIATTRLCDNFDDIGKSMPRRLFCESNDQTFPRILWAGDLNGDGELDLLLEEAWHYNVSQQTLLLSSGSGNKTRLVVAATFMKTGC